MFKHSWHSEVGFEPTFLLVKPGVVQCGDHLGGVDQQGFNQAFDILEPAEIHVEYVLPNWVKQKYPQHIFKFDAELMIRNNHFEKAISYKNTDRQLVFDNFLCCFNRSGHVGRTWLVNALVDRHWFNPQYCSCGFELPNKSVVLHGQGLDETDVLTNLKDLSPLIKSSFINLVSETMPENYIAFPTEKFLFPVLNDRLWVAYAPPGYHKFISQTLGFRLYTDVFDYSFDTIQDPQARLSALLDSLEPYAKLTEHNWIEIYNRAASTIEFNHQWATSGQFIQRLRDLNEVDKQT